jgi:CBS domain containing-hemolysin-like protein
MFLFTILITGLLFSLLVIVASMRPRNHVMSRFELERRVSQGDAQAEKTLRQTNLTNDILSLVQLLTVIVLVTLAYLSVAFFGWAIGSLVTIVATIAYSPIGRLSFVHKLAQRLYSYVEPKLITGITKYPALRMLRGAVFVQDTATSIHSREEFLHTIKKLDATVLHEREKRLIGASLVIDKTNVSSIMVPRDDIVTIKQNELLGPLTLDELHKTGHSRFPVVSGGIDSIVGVVEIDNLVTLADKKSPRARDVMAQSIHSVYQTDTLQKTLVVFLETHQNLLIVLDQDRKTVGLICLEDVIAAVFGRKLTGGHSSRDS